MPLRPFRQKAPVVGERCFVEASAQLIGDVVLGDDSSVWFNSVLRGDVNPIRIGRRTNVQDLSLVHVLSNRFGTELGDDVTVGHHVVLHGCRIGHRVLVGMGSVVLDGVEVADDCLIAAGSLLTPGTHIPSGSFVLGRPARVVRPLSDDEKARIAQSAQSYVACAREYLAAWGA